MMEENQLVFREVHAGNWGDLERLFEARGGPKNCWCMAWRPAPAGLKVVDKHTRKAALKKYVDDGVPIGILAYWGGEPVGWCSIAPRQTYRRLGGLEDEPGLEVWSLVCFYVPTRWRGRGILPRMIEAAVETARRHGADAVEAYPVEKDSPSYRFMGFVESFSAAGFEEAGMAGSRRRVFRRRI